MKLLVFGNIPLDSHQHHHQHTKKVHPPFILWKSSDEKPGIFLYGIKLNSWKCLLPAKCIVTLVYTRWCQWIQVQIRCLSWWSCVRKVDKLTLRIQTSTPPQRPWLMKHALWTTTSLLKRLLYYCALINMLTFDSSWADIIEDSCTTKLFYKLCW